MEKQDAANYADVFKALSDETRVKIMLMLNTRPRPVNEIVDFFSLAQPTISRHLHVLKECGLVVSKRKGQQVIYAIDEETLRSQGLGFFENFECIKSGGTTSAKKR